MLSHGVSGLKLDGTSCSDQARGELFKSFKGPLDGRRSGGKGGFMWVRFGQGGWNEDDASPNDQVGRWKPRSASCGYLFEEVKR